VGARAWAGASTMAAVPTYVFANNRGGLGKSTAVFQCAAAHAAAHPGGKTLVLDLSVHGDASTLLLGGTREPSETVEGARTRGTQALLSLPEERTAGGLLRAIAERQRSAGSIAGKVTGFFTGSKAVDVSQHCVRVAELTDSEVPENLYLCAGGKCLMGSVNEEGWVAAAAEAREALQQLGEGWSVFVDSDAELAERVPSRVALAVADRMVLLLSASWNDYCRTLDDPINGLFGVLTSMEQQNLPTPKITMVLFNHVKQKDRSQVRLHGEGVGFETDATLPFSPVKGVQAQMAQIADHCYETGWRNIERDWQRFYADAAAITDEGAFGDRYVTALFELPELANHASQLTGTPLCCMDPKTVYLKGTPNEMRVGKDTLEKCQADVAFITDRM